MVPLSRGLELLESALRYALAGAALGTPELLSCPTPCPGWDLAMLLDHLGDAIGVLHEALAIGGAGVRVAPGHAGAAAESAREGLGIRFVAVLPQLTPATALGAR